MWYFFILSFIILIAYIAGMQTADFEEKWMGIEFTTSLKGIGILTVVWAHVGKQLGVPAIQFIAGVGVALFLICSGYGIEKSFQKNGLKDFWKKRILSVYIPFAIVLIISRAIEVCFGKPFNLYNFIGGLFLIKANWYIRFIAICYIVFFAIKLISAHIKVQRFESVCWWLYILIAFIVYSTYVTDESAPFLQARQVLSFPLGVYMAQNMQEVERKIRKCSRGGIACGIIGIVFMGLTQMHFVKSLPYLISNSMALLTCVPLSISLLIFVSNKPKTLYNKTLKFCGVISYELFLVQMKTLQILNGGIQSWIAFSLLTVFCTAIIYSFDRMINYRRVKL